MNISMSDETDFLNLSSAPSQDKLTNADRASQSEADFLALRLVELQTAPIHGGFDALHLQQIHAHIFQDVDSSAGRFRSTGEPGSTATDVEKSLDNILDRLRRENHLKGRSPEEWTERAADYMHEITAIQPFAAGNDVAIREFASELARKNALALQWDDTSDISLDSELIHLQQTQQSLNLRRMIMLAMDTDPSPQHPGRGTAIERGLERVLSLGAG